MEKNLVRIVFWNARGILSKLTEFQNFLFNKNIDIACVCETFLKRGKTLNIRGYQCLTLARERGRLGGLLILIKKSIHHSQIMIPKLNILECIGINIHSSTGRAKHLILTYLPGKCQDGPIVKYLKRDILNIHQKFANTFIVGDLNAKHTDWNCQSQNKAGTIIQDICEKYPLFVSAPSDHTYCPLSNFFNPSTIDLIITDGHTEHSRPWVIKDFQSDHLPVRFDVQLQHCPTQQLTFCYQRANWSLFRATLNQGLPDPELETQQPDPASIDKAIEQLNETIMRARDVAIPLMNESKDRIIIPEELRTIIRLRNKFRSKFIKNRDPTDKIICKSLCAIINEEIASLKAKRWEKQLSAINSNNPKIYQLIKSRKSIKILPSLTNADETLLSNQDIADDLAQNFAKAHQNPLKEANKAFTKKVERTVKNYIKGFTNEQPVIISKDEVWQIIHSIKPNKSPGPDQINGKLLKNISEKCFLNIVQIINNCWKSCYFPRAWKKATTVAIPKPDKDHRYSANYRPISLLSIIGKTLEKTIEKRITIAAHERKVLPDFQFGFRQRHSTNHQLVRIYNVIDKSLKNKSSTGLITLDIEKAFDSVWHDGLIFKLISWKFPRRLIELTKSFLQDRVFRVKIDNAYSNEQSIPYGSPQGSILSPILYNIYTSDIPTDEHCGIALYADDTAIYTESRFVKQINKRLTGYFIKIERFYYKWKIKINSNKTTATFFTKRKTKQLPSDSLTLGGCKIEWDSTVKYLGYTFDKTLTHAAHIDKTCVKCDNIIRVLYPFVNRKSAVPLNVKVLIYKLYIRPVLSYAFQLTTRASRTQFKKLIVKENKILRLLLNIPPDTSTLRTHELAGMNLFDDSTVNQTIKFVNQCKDHVNPLIGNLYPNQSD